MLYNGDAGAWDAVVTCFFIDTAHNIVEYIEIISQILKDGGVSSLIEIQIDLVYLFFPPVSICSLVAILISILSFILDEIDTITGLDKSGPSTLSLCRYVWPRRCKILFTYNSTIISVVSVSYNL
jgi:hypothetical protein